MKKTILFLAGHLLGFNGFAQDYTKPETTEVWEPKPKIVTPGPLLSAPPSDALVLFDGKNLDAWTDTKGKPSQWVVNSGIVTIKPDNGDLVSKQKFGDCQLHLEFRLPEDAKSSGTNAGNSGVFLQERYEVQIFDSYNYEVPLYANGMAGSIYKQSIPLANAMTRPGTWNAYDMYYTAPRFRANGSLEEPAYVTVVHNGVLVLNHFKIHGTIQYIGIPKYETHGKASLVLQGHGSPVSFRNIWIREL